MQPGDKVVLGLPLEFRVAGTGYERRYSTIRRYGERNRPVRLIPEPTNTFDRHAIAVHMLWHTAKATEVWDTIGYVPAEMSATVNELIRSGEWAIDAAYVRRLDASPELDAPKVIVRLEGKDLRVSTTTERT